MTNFLLMNTAAFTATTAHTKRYLGLHGSIANTIFSLRKTKKYVRNVYYLKKTNYGYYIA